MDHRARSLKELLRAGPDPMGFPPRVPAHPEHARLVAEVMRRGPTPVSQFIEERAQEEAADPILAAARDEVRRGE